MIKKILVFIIIMITPFIVLALPKGDINGDNKVDSYDYALMRNHIRKKTLLTGNELKRADVDGQNGVDNRDYALIRNTIKASISSSPTPTVKPATPKATSTPKVTAKPTITPKATVKPTVTPKATAKPTITPKVTAKPTITPKATAKPTTTPTATPLTAEEKICESVKNNSSIDYKSFASLKKNNDDYYVIRAAHNCANKYNKPVVVTKATYNIYNKTENNIIVKTNTDLSNSTIYIHDESGIVGTKHSNHIYKIAGDSCSSKKITVSDIKEGSVISELSGSTNGYFVSIKDLNDNRKTFIRYGGNANSGINARDAFRVDKNGKILDPLFWSYKGSKIKMEYCSISTNTLTFKNAKIYTIVDTTTSKNVKSSNSSQYLRRGISISRSNVIIDNISHIMINKSKKQVSEVNHGYYGFFAVHGVANVTLKNLKVYTVKNNNANVNSTYEIILDNVANIKLNNVVAADYDKTSSYFKKSSNLLRDNRWGMISSNNAKNIMYDSCVLNRIDTHTGVYNLTVKNTKLGRHRFTQTGFGNLVIENVDVYYSNSFIYLRQDYGSTWKGKITINNSRIHPMNNNNVSIVSFAISYDGNHLHNFGYDLYLPNIEINGFKIDSTVSKLFIFDNSQGNTGLVKGNLSKVKNYIKNKQFKYYYPNKSNIKVSNISNNKGSIKHQNYLISFGEN